MLFNKLNNRISFIHKENKKDDYGQVRPVEEELFSTWAEIRTQQLKDIEATIGTVLEDTITFIIRYRQPQEIDNTMKIKHKGNTYEIVKISPDEAKGQIITIVCKKVS